ncbi:MAG: HTTM domain-containing protein [Ferruginibacter sp.]
MKLLTNSYGTMLQLIKHYKVWLEKDNYKVLYLAFLRVAISVWLLQELIFNLPILELLYSSSSFVIPQKNFLNWLPWGYSLIRTHYMWFIVCYMGVIILNIFGIGRWVTGLLLFVMTHILQKMNLTVLDGGDVMARLILLYLIFADSYQYFVLFKQKKINNARQKVSNLLSNLAAFSIMLHLCLAYFTSGLLKINDPYWWKGEAIYYTLQMERFIGTPLNKYIIQHPWIELIINYAVLAFELIFPVLVWIKKCRKPLLIMGILFHIGIFIFLMIYGFQVVFVLIYGLFLPNNKLVRLKEKAGNYIRF